MAEVERLPAAQVLERSAALVAESLRAVIAEKGHASLAVPGGSALAPLAAVRKLLGPGWKAVRLTWVDERCVAFASAESNRGEAYRSHAIEASDPPGLELPLWLDDESQAQAIERVEQALAHHFGDRLDVALLGMGPDGHIASLFPGHPLLLTEGEARVQALNDSPKPPAARMTLSRRFLMRTSHPYLVALGESKREALQRTLRGDPELPLSHFQNLTILTDIDLGATP